MIIGAPLWQDKDSQGNPFCRFHQDNNAIEKFKKLINPMHYLETCGPTSACICLAAIYGNIFNISIALGVQPEDLLFIHLLNPFNFPDIKAPNRCWEPYIKAVKVQYGKTIKKYVHLEYNQIITHIKSGHAIQICFVDPGHFNAIIAYDTEKDLLLRVDPWPNNPANKNGGWLEELTREEFNKNVQKTFLVYGE